jgi:hypothetical protein
VDADRDWPAIVPTVHGPIDPAGHWRGALVGPGTGDLMAVALASGAAPGDVVVHLGTGTDGSSVSVVADSPTTDRTGHVVSLADATGRYLPTVRLAVDGDDAVLAAVGVLSAHARTDGERWWLTGDPTVVADRREALAADAGCPVVGVPGPLAATGACIQAAAVLLRRAPDEVQAAWQVAGSLVGAT